MWLSMPSLLYENGARTVMEIICRWRHLQVINMTRRWVSCPRTVNGTGTATCQGPTVTGTIPRHYWPVLGCAHLLASGPGACRALLAELRAIYHGRHGPEPLKPEHGPGQQSDQRHAALSCFLVVADLPPCRLARLLAGVAILGAFLGLVGRGYLVLPRARSSPGAAAPARRSSGGAGTGPEAHPALSRDRHVRADC